MYEAGIGTVADPEIARSWYEKAARLGNMEGQQRLISWFLGKTGAEARRQAIYWGRQAALSGDAKAMNDYAWLLATSKFDKMRNGTLALDQAEKAVAKNASPAYLDTLAAAYAEIGNFEQAVTVQLQALDALDADTEGLRRELEERLAQYRRSQPWRE